MATATKAPTRKDKTKYDTVCPFCPMLCDDVTIRDDGETLKPLRLSCKSAASEYGRITRDYVQPTLTERGKDSPSKKFPVKIEEAIDSAATLLGNARKPFFGGLGTDVDALRKLYQLAANCGATIDHMHSAAALANAGVFQTLGWTTTTLAEIRNRADVVLLVGADCKNRYGRFVERILEPRVTLATAARKNRRVFYLGPRKN
ncbi:MAG: hypothetical protein AAF387_02795, partial [Pseudomonadota bacterium]